MHSKNVFGFAMRCITYEEQELVSVLILMACSFWKHSIFLTLSCPTLLISVAVWFTSAQ